MFGRKPETTWPSASGRYGVDHAGFRKARHRALVRLSRTPPGRGNTDSGDSIRLPADYAFALYKKPGTLLN